jgi:hypothetical protein
MGTRKREPLSDGKKNIIASLITEYGVESVDDIREALKDLLANVKQFFLRSGKQNFPCAVSTFFFMR